MSDLIRRQDAIDAVRDFQADEAEYHYYKHYAEEVITSLPSTDRPTREWIPVSERLPKECDGCVLVSKEDGQVTTGLHSEFSNEWYIGDMCGVGGCKVIAWMPLPEPYKGGEE